MRPSRIRKSASTLRKILETSEAIEVLNVASADDFDASKDIIKASSSLSRQLGEAGEDTKALAKEIGFEDIAGPEFWQQLLDSDEDTGRAARQKRARLKSIRGILDTLTRLLRPAEKNLPMGSDKDQFTLVIPDLNGGTRPVSNVREALAACENLYQIYRTVRGTGEDTEQDGSDSGLEITTAETGSELAFVFVGAAPIIVAVGGLLLVLWDRIQFRDERSFSEQISAVSESLDLIDEIEDKREELGERRAEKLKSQVTDSAKSILSSGAVPEEGQATHQETAKRIASNETRALPREETQE